MPGRVKFNQLSSKEQKALGEFYDMVASLKNRAEAKNFFKDLMSLSEIVMVSRRIQIAKRLLKGFTYEEIIEEMKVGRATVSSVDKWVNVGFDGYRDVIKKHNLNNPEKKNFNIDEFPISLDSLRKRYPAHFLLLNIFKGIKNK